MSGSDDKARGLEALGLLIEALTGAPGVEIRVANLTRVVLLENVIEPALAYRKEHPDKPKDLGPAVERYLVKNLRNQETALGSMLGMVITLIDAEVAAREAGARALTLAVENSRLEGLVGQLTARAARLDEDNANAWSRVNDLETLHRVNQGEAAKQATGDGTGKGV